MWEKAENLWDLGETNDLEMSDWTFTTEKIAYMHSLQ